MYTMINMDPTLKVFLTLLPTCVIFSVARTYHLLYTGGANFLFGFMIVLYITCGFVFTVSYLKYRNEVISYTGLTILGSLYLIAIIIISYFISFLLVGSLIYTVFTSMTDLIIYPLEFIHYYLTGAMKHTTKCGYPMSSYAWSGLFNCLWDAIWIVSTNTYYIFRIWLWEDFSGKVIDHFVLMDIFNAYFPYCKK